MYNSQGERTWAVEYDIYGKIRKLVEGNANDCPFRYQGQYEDGETGLYYNRFRYYSAEEGVYLSQDPIKLAGKNPTLYSYVHDSNNSLDPFGLAECSISDHKFLYRFDKRTPKEIKDSGGFKSYGNNMDLLAHTKGDTISGLNKTSGYISTTKYESVAEEFAGITPGYIYKIKNPGDGIDVNKTLGVDSPFPHEMEVAIKKEIPFADIVEYYPINTY